MDRCRTCRHWILNDAGFVVLSSMIENWHHPIESVEQLKKNMGFEMRECTHKKMISNRKPPIEKDSVLIQYEGYQDRPAFFTGPDFCCRHYESNPVTL